MREPCQRLCVDDLCRGGSPLCGGDFCQSCYRACMFDETLCDDCADKEARFDDDCMEDERIDRAALPEGQKEP